MPLTQLVYVSQRTPRLSNDLLTSIVDQSAVNNSKCGVTGVLLCFGRELMQLLEGEMSEVSSLFGRIKADGRHAGIQCLVFKPVKKRVFPEWSMGLADMDSKARLDRNRLTRMLDDVRGTAPTETFSAEARLLLSDFRQQLATSISSDRTADLLI